MTHDHGVTPQPQPMPAPTGPASGAAAESNHQPGANSSGGLLTTIKDLVWSKGPTAPATMPHDSMREVAETIVFVVVLVLLLKSFIAEAFVIPTGSMADTLWGYQKVIACPQCPHIFPVNCSQEVDPQDGSRPLPVTGCICPNCRLPIHIVRPPPLTEEGQKELDQPVGAALAPDEVLDPGPSSGDRVLVVKYLYDVFSRSPERYEVVVFKFPGDEGFPARGPQQNWVQMNYIKRLIGLGNETIGIHYGDLYAMKGSDPPAAEVGVPAQDLWRKHYMHTTRVDDGLPRNGSGFHILQKSPEKILAMQRLVYNNDQPAKDLNGVQPARWAGVDERWAKAEGHAFRHAAKDDDQLHWLRYQHILRGQGDKPQLITDFLGYNTYQPRRLGGATGPNWVGDLILECDVTVEEPKGELVLELSHGVERFRAKWDLASGQWKLYRLRWAHEGTEPPAEEAYKEIASADKPGLKGKGTYQLRFANVDEKLVVWVNGKLPFDDGVSYANDPLKKPGPYSNDLQPASIGVKGGGVKVDHLQLWRDTYYTVEPGQADGAPENNDWSNPSRWQALQSLSGKTFYVQPGHYLCLGDNSPESSDGRSWGTVPERLMLGRALMVYYPFKFPIWPLNSPVNRVGPIK